jgi:hypothetical protein
MIIEILPEYINIDLLPRLLLTIPAHFLSWLVFFKLGFQLTGDKVKIRKVILGALICGMYALCARERLPELVYGLLIVVLLAVLLTITGKIMILRAIWASGYVYWFILLGNAALVKPLLAWSKATGFLAKVASHAATGALMAAVFPALALLIFSTFNISLIPSVKNRVTGLDLWGNLLFGILILSIYNFTVMFCLNSQNPALMKITITELVLIVIGLMAFFIIRYLLERQREQENLRFQREKIAIRIEHSNRLLNTIASERREFRNRLQVINMFAEVGKNVDLSNYIQSVALQMSETKMADNIENPIILAVIMYHTILGREKGVETVIYSNTSLNDFANDLIKLVETLDVILGLFIANEVLSRSVTKKVFLDVKDDGEYYNFQFDNSEEAASSFKNGKYNNYKLPCALKYPEDGLKDFKGAGVLIKDLQAKPQYIVKGGYVVQLSFRLKKKPSKKTRFVETKPKTK